jgi:hypothetical protein
MVQRAHRQAVRDDRLAARVRVAQNVGGFQELSLAKSAYCALHRVRADDLAAKDPLMEALLDLPSGVAPTIGGIRLGLTFERQQQAPLLFRH